MLFSLCYHINKDEDVAQYFAVGFVLKNGKPRKIDKKIM